MEQSEILEAATFKKSTQGEVTYYDFSLPEPIKGIGSLSIPAENEAAARAELTRYLEDTPEPTSFHAEPPLPK